MKSGEIFENVFLQLKTNKGKKPIIKILVRKKIQSVLTVTLLFSLWSRFCTDAGISPVLGEWKTPTFILSVLVFALPQLFHSFLLCCFLFL